MTLNNSDRDIDLELAEQLLAHPWETRKASCPNCYHIPVTEEEQNSGAKSFMGALVPMYLTVFFGLILWLFRTELAEGTVDVLAYLRQAVLTWLDFPSV